VWEWVQDVWHPNYRGAPNDGSAWTGGSDQAHRVFRGGSWSNLPWDLRSANHNAVSQVGRYSHTGFRVARTL
jgi:formylglycine-generating enzyme required for sulfatase activity